MNNPIVPPARYCTHGYIICLRLPDGRLAHDAAALAYLPSTDPRVVVYLADPINRKLAEDLGSVAAPAVVRIPVNFG